jgi:hypothetical protein
VSSKRIIKHQNAKGRTLYGLILTPAELILVRGLIGVLYHGAMPSPTQRRHLDLWGALAEVHDDSVAFDRSSIALRDVELMGLLNQEALEPDPFSEEEET